MLGKSMNVDLADHKSVGAIELAPLSLGELLDRAFTLYRRHFAMFVGIMAVPSSLLVPIHFYYWRTRISLFAFARRGGQAHSTGLAIGFIFATWLLLWIANAAITCAASQVYFGRDATVREPFGSIRSRMGNSCVGFSRYMQFRGYCSRCHYWNFYTRGQPKVRIVWRGARRKFWSPRTCCRLVAFGKVCPRDAGNTP